MLSFLFPLIHNSHLKLLQNNMDNVHMHVFKIYSSLVPSFLAQALILFNSFAYSEYVRSIVNLSNICHIRSSGFLWFCLHTQRNMLIRFHWIFSTSSGSSNLTRSVNNYLQYSVLLLLKQLKDNVRYCTDDCNG